MSVQSFPALLRRHGATCVKPHYYVIEASTLRLPVGYWPNVFWTDLGNGLALRFAERLPDGGARYRQDLGGVTVDVWND